MVYTTKFKQLALESGYDKIAQIQMYHDGLNDSIKDSLAQAISVPEELEAYMEICIKIDNRQFSRRMENLQNHSYYYCYYCYFKCNSNATRLSPISS